MKYEDEQDLRNQIIHLVFGTQADSNMDLILADRIYKWVIGYREKTKENESV